MACRADMESQALGFESWASAAMRAAVSQVYDALESRIAVLRRQSGCPLELCLAGDATIPGFDCAVAALRIVLRPSSVDVYAARLGADVSEYMAKLDALGAPPGMVYVPAGEFLSGAPEERKRVELPAFFIDTDLVTNRKYHDYMRATGTPPPPHWLDRNIHD